MSYKAVMDTVNRLMYILDKKSKRVTISRIDENGDSTSYAVDRWDSKNKCLMTLRTTFDGMTPIQSDRAMNTFNKIKNKTEVEILTNGLIEENKTEQFHIKLEKYGLTEEWNRLQSIKRNNNF